MKTFLKCSSLIKIIIKKIKVIINITISPLIELKMKGQIKRISLGICQVSVMEEDEDPNAGG